MFSVRWELRVFCKGGSCVYSVEMAAVRILWSWQLCKFCRGGSCVISVEEAAV